MADSLPLATAAARHRSAHPAGHAARAFAESGPLQFLARFGYVVRGVIHSLSPAVRLGLRAQDS